MFRIFQIYQLQTLPCLAPWLAKVTFDFKLSNKFHEELLEQELFFCDRIVYFTGGFTPDHKDPPPKKNILMT